MNGTITGALRFLDRNRKLFIFQATVLSASLLILIFYLALQGKNCLPGSTDFLFILAYSFTGIIASALFNAGLYEYRRGEFHVRLMAGSGYKPIHAQLLLENIAIILTAGVIAVTIADFTFRIAGDGISVQMLMQGERSALIISGWMALALTAISLPVFLLKTSLRGGNGAPTIKSFSFTGKILLTVQLGLHNYIFLSNATVNLCLDDRLIIPAGFAVIAIALAGILNFFLYQTVWNWRIMHLSGKGDLKALAWKTACLAMVIFFIALLPAAIHLNNRIAILMIAAADLAMIVLIKKATELIFSRDRGLHIKI